MGDNNYPTEAWRLEQGKKEAKAKKSKKVVAAKKKAPK